MADIPSWLSSDNDDDKSSAVVTPSSTTTTTADDWSNPPAALQASTTTSSLQMDRGDASTVAAPLKTWGEFWGDSFRRDGGLIFVTICICILSNIPYGYYVVYPFVIFATWIHETCHGIAAWMVGYNVTKLELFADGSGLAYYEMTGSDERRGFVASAGYQGTAVIGMLLLLLRRTKRGPRMGISFLSICMVITLAAWIRSPFGIAFMAGWTVVLTVAAWTLTSPWLRGLYLVISASTALNAIFAIKQLFGDNVEVNGEKFPSDAHAMGELKAGGSIMWACIWLGLGILCLLLGFMFAIPGPDEKAEFTCCRACQKAKCFACCNAPGCRLWAKMRGRDGADQDSGSVV